MRAAGYETGQGRTMELRHLRYFVAVAEELHFGHAAERLRVVQPAVSAQIRRLERELDLQLFVRSSRGVRLTEVGRAFLEDARASLDHSERAVRKARKAASGEVGRVRVGLIGSATYHVLTEVVGPFRERFPEVLLAPREMDAVSQVEALKAERLDVGFLHLPSNHGHEDLQTETFVEEPLVAVLPVSHPLAGSTRVGLGEISGGPFVLADRAQEPGWNEQLRDAFGGVGSVPEATEEATDLTVALGLVTAGVGVTLLPASARNLRMSGVVYRELTTPAPTVELSVAWSRASLPPAARAFLEFTTDSVPR